ncbi:PF20097 family protein [Bremerella sp. JC770]|uniref:PF20097 family protein n=1 Tax=Bremerella sp. JC770 TaxID=3232137 RepID=UPI0034593CC6
MAEVKCPDCDEMMEEGFVPEFINATSIIQSRWVKGQAEFSNLTPLAFGGYTHAMRVTSYRCPDCGLLRSYALPKERKTTSSK